MSLPAKFNDITPQSYYPSYEPAAYGSIKMYITVTMTYMTSGIFVITSSDYGLHQIIAWRNIGLSVEQV